MTFPAVQVNQVNQIQGELTDVLRHLLFIGKAAKNIGKTLSVNTDSDFDALLGTEDSSLKANLKAAMLNAGQNWTAGVYVLADGEDWTEAAHKAQLVQSFEGIMLCEAVTDALDISLAQALRHELVAKYGRFQFIGLTTVGINAETEVWADWEAKMVALQDMVAADGVMLVPAIWQDAIGKLAGRLCNRSVSIADSPCRVKTGALLGDVTLPVDAAGQELGSATLQTLEQNRLSVPMWYPDFDGVYWCDGRVLDVEGGDFQVIEYRRVMDNIARIMRLRAIPRIGDRSLNSSPGSMASAKNYFMRDLKVMSKSTVINGTPVPGDIQPPDDEDITILWKSKVHVEIYATAQPHDCPKKITINLMLDLSNPAEG